MVNLLVDGTVYDRCSRVVEDKISIADLLQHHSSIISQEQLLKELINLFNGAECN